MNAWRVLGRVGVLVGLLGMLTHCGGEEAEGPFAPETPDTPSTPVAPAPQAPPAPGTAVLALTNLSFAATFQRFELEHWPVTPTAVATDANGSLILTGSLQGRVDLGGGVLDAGQSSVEDDDAAAGALVAKFDFDGRPLLPREALATHARSFSAGASPARASPPCPWRCAAAR